MKQDKVEKARFVAEKLKGDKRKSLSFMLLSRKVYNIIMKCPKDKSYLLKLIRENKVQELNYDLLCDDCKLKVKPLLEAMKEVIR